MANVAFNGQPFDPSQVEASTGDFDPIPPGEYQVLILDSVEKMSKAGNKMIGLTFEVVGPSHAGRRIWENLNMEHPNDKVVSIAYATLSAICAAAGVGSISDTVELHNRMMTVSVKIDPGTNGYSDSNKVSKYHKAAATPATPAAPAVPAPAPAPAAAAPAAGNTQLPPWKQ